MKRIRRIMGNKKIEWGKEIIQTGSDLSEIGKDVGIPGVGLLARFAQTFYSKHLQKRFEQFVTDAELDGKFIDKIVDDETYSNCFYATLETVRQTHSRIGLIALALIYRDHWDDETYLIAATRAFCQISDKTVEAFLTLYESIPDDRNYLLLTVLKDGEGYFHDSYSEAVELILRNFFVSSEGAGMGNNTPIQGMKWDHTESYYGYCKRAKEVFETRKR